MHQVMSDACASGRHAAHCGRTECGVGDKKIKIKINGAEVPQRQRVFVKCQQATCTSSDSDTAAQLADAASFERKFKEHAKDGDVLLWDILGVKLLKLTARVCELHGEWAKLIVATQLWGSGKGDDADSSSSHMATKEETERLHTIVTECMKPDKLVAALCRGTPLSVKSATYLLKQMVAVGNFKDTPQGPSEEQQQTPRTLVARP
ncbi:unnamed protein product [Chrysoparadoxa australica]